MPKKKPFQKLSLIAKLPAHQTGIETNKQTVPRVRPSSVPRVAVIKQDSAHRASLNSARKQSIGFNTARARAADSIEVINRSMETTKLGLEPPPRLAGERGTNQAGREVGATRGTRRRAASDELLRSGETRCVDAARGNHRAASGWCQNTGSRDRGVLPASVVSEDHDPKLWRGDGDCVAAPPRACTILHRMDPPPPPGLHHRSADRKSVV